GSLSSSAGLPSTTPGSGLSSSDSSRVFLLASSADSALLQAPPKESSANPTNSTEQNVKALFISGAPCTLAQLGCAQPSLVPSLGSRPLRSSPRAHGAADGSHPRPSSRRDRSSACHRWRAEHRRVLHTASHRVQRCRPHAPPACLDSAGGPAPPSP